MVSRTETRSSTRPGTSPNAQEFELDLSSVDNDDAPERCTVIVDYDHEEIVVDGADQEWCFDVLDPVGGRVEQRSGGEPPVWVDGVLKYVGVEEAR